MKFCSNCGKEVSDQAVVCPHCGCAVQNDALDVPSMGLNILSLFFPLIGLILYLVFRDKTPRKAAAVGKFALIGFIAGIGLTILMYGCSAALLMASL